MGALIGRQCRCHCRGTAFESAELKQQWVCECECWVCLGSCSVCSLCWIWSCGSTAAVSVWVWMLGVFRIVFGVFFVLNLILWINSSSAAVPFSTLVALLALWFGISAPLTFVGTYFGFRKPVWHACYCCIGFKCCHMMLPVVVWDYWMSLRPS